jgi:abortive infection bacteriophage resistance protein
MGRAEVALRARLSDSMSAAFAPHWFLREECFDRQTNYKGLIAKIESDINHDSRWERKRGVAVRHYYQTYGEPRLPPSWTIMEELSLGTISRILADLAPAHRKRIARTLRVDESVLTSWLRALSYTRNLCAHHMRLWNRKFTLRPKVARISNGFFDTPRTGARSMTASTRKFLCYGRCWHHLTRNGPSSSNSAWTCARTPRNMNVWASP